MRTDRSEFRASSHYAPYTLSTDPPSMGAFVPDWLLARAVAHELSVLALDVGLLGDATRAQAFGQRCRTAGVELIGSVSVDLSALEPHMDYRCAELVQVVEAVGSPRLRLVFDFADSLSVNEDPLEAIHQAAPYTVAAHVRDMRVQALTEIATGAFFHTPVGDGHVPVGAMLDVLATASDDSERLPCCLKVVTRPEHDVEAWLRASIASVRENHGTYWLV